MKLLSFGEILYDVFGDCETLGGAPLNVAAHYRMLGGESAIISAVGDDRRGRGAIKAIEELSVDASLIAVSEKAPTGIAAISMNGHDADYEFNYPAAWDRIEVDEDALERYADGSILCFGTLALRSTASFMALEDVLGTTSPEEVFVDINIRKDFYSDGILGFCLDNATILKVNADEVGIITDLIGIDEDAEALFSWLQEYTAVERLIVTRGKDGSDLHTVEGLIHEGCSKVKVVDTVGAGDSLSAAYLFFRFENGLSDAEALHKATAVADFVVQNKGAIPHYDASMFI